MSPTVVVDMIMDVPCTWATAKQTTIAMIGTIVLSAMWVDERHGRCARRS